MILCKSCSVPRDYGNGWVYCPYRVVWLKNGYKNCRGYMEGARANVVHTGAEPSKLFQDSKGSTS